MNTVGEKIKGLRELKKISLEEVSARSGLEVNQIQQIEDGNSIPSLSPMIKIARALGVRLGTFVDDSKELGPVVHRLADQADKGASFSSQNSGSHEYLNFYSLASNKMGRHMEPYIIDINPAPTPDFKLSQHEGEEFIYCMEGVVEVNYGKNTYVLNPGDSIYYDCIVAHSVHGYNNQQAKILAVVYTPI